MQKVSVKRQFCSVCDKETKHERHTTTMGGGDLVLVLFTWGLWLVVRWFFTPPYRCSVCGNSERKK